MVRGTDYRPELAWQNFPLRERKRRLTFDVHKGKTHGRDLIICDAKVHETLQEGTRGFAYRNNKIIKQCFFKEV